MTDGAPRGAPSAYLALKSELLRWMFLFWVGTMGTVVLLLKL